MQVTGLDKLTQFLRARAAKALAESKEDVQVGFEAAYAIFVHEDLEAKHAAGTSAKFLEQPAREQQAELAGIMRDALRGGRTISQALLVTGLTLQGMAQRLCPVDTGNLRASAYTRLVDRVGATLAGDNVTELGSPTP